jgi:hypothetical protein
VFVFGASLAGGAQKRNLPAVTPAPFAKQQMDAQADAFPKWQGLVEGVGLKAHGLFAIRGKIRDSPGKGFHQSL